MEKRKKKIPIRIRVEDAADILGISLRSASKVLREISARSKKPNKKVVTLKEFCDHNGFSMEEIKLHFLGVEE
jgi:hypothetical protein